MANGKTVTNNGVIKWVATICGGLLVVLLGAWILWVSNSTAQIGVIKSTTAQQFEYIKKELSDINERLDKLG